MIKSIKAIINKLPPNKYVRVAAISAAIGATFLLLPFVVGGTGAWFAYSKITSPKLKYFVAGAVAVMALFIGIPWTQAFFAGENATTIAPVVEQVPTPTAAQPSPKIETKTITETQEVAFESSTINDSTLESGKTAVKTAGVKGLKTLTWEITLTDGVETSKKLIKEEVITAPIAEVIRKGTKVATPPASSNCDPNYSGCVPIDTDVDCAGGDGNGPSYVRGPIRVLGVDIYKLDNDKDGIACE